MLYPNDFLCDLLFDSDKERMKAFFEQEFQSQKPNEKMEKASSPKLERIKSMVESLAFLEDLSQELKAKNMPEGEVRRIIEDIRRDILVHYRRE